MAKVGQLNENKPKIYSPFRILPLLLAACGGGGGGDEPSVAGRDSQPEDNPQTADNRLSRINSISNGLGRDMLGLGGDPNTPNIYSPSMSLLRKAYTEVTASRDAYFANSGSRGGQGNQREGTRPDNSQNPNNPPEDGVLEYEIYENTRMESVFAWLGRDKNYTLDTAFGDGARVSIKPNGGLSWKAGFSPDFENPLDLDKDNTYSIRVTAPDGTRTRIDIKVRDLEDEGVNGSQKSQFVSPRKGLPDHKLPSDAAQQIMTGGFWLMPEGGGPLILTWSFDRDNSVELSPAEIEAFRMLMLRATAVYENVINVRFVEVEYTDDRHGDILLGVMSRGEIGLAHIPQLAPQRDTAMTILLDKLWAKNNSHIILHELGHIMGLGHPERTHPGYSIWHKMHGDESWPKPYTGELKYGFPVSSLMDVRIKDGGWVLYEPEIEALRYMYGAPQGQDYEHPLGAPLARIDGALLSRPKPTQEILLADRPPVAIEFLQYKLQIRPSRDDNLDRIKIADLRVVDPDHDDDFSNWTFRFTGLDADKFEVVNGGLYIKAGATPEVRGNAEKWLRAQISIEGSPAIEDIYVVVTESPQKTKLHLVITEYYNVGVRLEGNEQLPAGSKYSWLINASHHGSKSKHELGPWWWNSSDGPEPLSAGFEPDYVLVEKPNGDIHRLNISDNMIYIYHPDISPTPGEDSFFARPDDGDNIIFGWSGVQHLDGMAGNDWLHGGTGNDVLTGGKGDDIFFADLDWTILYFGLSDYHKRTPDRLTITDFTANEDKIAITERDEYDYNAATNILTVTRRFESSIGALDGTHVESISMEVFLRGFDGEFSDDDIYLFDSTSEF